MDSEAERAEAAELAKQNAKRSGKGKIKRAKLTLDQRSKVSTQNEERTRRVTRSMEKEKSRGAGSSRRRKSDPGGTKRKLMEDDDEEMEEVGSSEHAASNMTDGNSSFDLFPFGEEKKKDWDEHPDMEK